MQVLVKRYFHSTLKMPLSLFLLTISIILHGFPLLPDLSIILRGYPLLPDCSHHTKQLSWKIFQCSKPITPASCCLHILFSSVKKFCWPQLLEGTQKIRSKPISPSSCVSTVCPPHSHPQSFPSPPFWPQTGPSSVQHPMTLLRHKSVDIPVLRCAISLDSHGVLPGRPPAPILTPSPLCFTKMRITVASGSHDLAILFTWEAFFRYPPS